MAEIFRKFVRDEKGEDLIEYGLLAAFVAMVATVVLIADPLNLRSAVASAFKKAANALNSM